MKTGKIIGELYRNGCKLVRVPISAPNSWSGVGHKWEITTLKGNHVVEGRTPVQAFARWKVAKGVLEKMLTDKVKSV